jgi:preprotein translocase subunit SecB
MDQTKQPGISLERIFLKSAKFSHRSDPLAPLPEAMRRKGGSIDLEIEMSGSDDGGAALVLRASNDPKDDCARYDFVVEMVGVFEPIAGAENMRTSEYARTNGLALMFPFVRETVANLTSRGRFGPLWLNPTNIRALFTAVTDEPVSDDVAPADEPATV